MPRPLFERAEDHGSRVAVVAPEGSFTYADLVATAESAATRLIAGREDLESARVCFLSPPGWDYVSTLWGIWRAGGVAVPLATSHPPAELGHVLDDAEPDTVVVHPDFYDRLRSVTSKRGLAVLQTPALLRPGSASDFPELDANRGALMLYTSGTTGQPKGVVLTHGNLEAQVGSLSEAWAWSPDDQILLALPLHHVHGIVNVLTCALWNGASCEILPRFNAIDVWERLARGELTLFMAVPTIYRRLIEAWEAADLPTRDAWSSGARVCRLMVSGSAALPLATFKRWEQITFHRLLERYGMTEIGMALSNPLVGERRPRHVGQPLPGVDVRLADEHDRAVAEGSSGEIQVRGPTVFHAYWRRPDETAAAFTADGYFRTGDLAVVDQGAYRILGRMSVDILKTGGEKISALEVEEVLRLHPAVSDCAVIGLPDSDWGDRVCAAVVGNPSAGGPSTQGLRDFAKTRLAPYKVPKDILIVDDLPRNAMGKVAKTAVRELFEDGEGS